MFSNLILIFISGEDSYSSNSGTNSDSETSDHNKTDSSATTSVSASPTAELSKYKFDHLDTYSISDVLICHTDKTYKNCVIWVIRRSGNLEALVFECVSEDYARQLYRNFHEVSKRSKLERHRRRKSDGGSIVTRSTDYLSGIGGGGGKSDYRGSIAVTGNNINNNDLGSQIGDSSKGSGKGGDSASSILAGNSGSSGAGNASSSQPDTRKWNLVQHTDRNGVTHIEVESSMAASNLVRPGRLEASDPPRSIISFSPAKFSARRTPGMGKSSEKSKFAKELESILSNEIKRRDDPTSDKKEGESVPERRENRRPTGESLSLRQRAPALLLRKLDEFEEKAQKIWAKAEAEEENRKIWSKSSNSVIGISSPPRGPTLASPKPGVERIKYKKPPGKDGKEDSIKEDHKPTTSTAIQPQNTNYHPQQENATRKQKEQSVTKKDDNRILIPTKTGKEPPKKLYPKESPPIFSGRLFPLGMGQVGLAPPPGPQPHSLPIYPYPQMGWPRVPGDFSQVEAWKFAQEQQWRQSAATSVLQAAAAAQQQQHHHQQAQAQERSRSRDRGRFDPDVRRRAQSKSPARRPVGGRLDSNPEEHSRFGRMFREFGDAVRNRIGGGGNGAKSGYAKSAIDLPDAAALKSNLKKQRNVPASMAVATATPVQQIHQPSPNTSSDNKKVHFNKFATVQMMER